MTDELSLLKNEIEILKKQVGSPGGHNQLTGAIQSLNKIFSEASEDLKIDTHDAVLVGDKLDRIIARLEKVEIQNEKIAKGIVALADMIEDKSGSSLPKERVRRTVAPPPSAKPSAGPQQLPRVDMPQGGEEKKKGFLNFKI